MKVGRGFKVQAFTADWREVGPAAYPATPDAAIIACRRLLRKAPSAAAARVYRWDTFAWAVERTVQRDTMLKGRTD